MARIPRLLWAGRNRLSAFLLRLDVSSDGVLGYVSDRAEVG